jgi:hypothetical protein
MTKTILVTMLTICCAGPAVADVSYSTFNYPDAAGGETFLTGIRADGLDGVFMTGVFTPLGESATQGLLYRGSITSNSGAWTVVNYPDADLPEGVLVTSTALYGPNDLGGGSVRAVGSYKTSESGGFDIGLLYEGPTDGTGVWTTLDAAALDIATINTIAHSTHGGLAVGNYDTVLVTGKAFVYDIDDELWYDLDPVGAVSITAYGIWHNGGTSYTIAGGFSEGLSFTGLDQGYLVDWDSADQSTSNWRAYNFDDLPFEDAVSHFDGITGDGNGGYNLTGDYIGVGAENGLGFFASVRRTLGDSFGSAVWTQISYPSGTGLDVDVASGNSVYENRVFGISPATGEGIAQGYVAVVPEASASALAVTALAGILLLRRKRASVVAR